MHCFLDNFTCTKGGSASSTWSTDNSGAGGAAAAAAAAADFAGTFPNNVDFSVPGAGTSNSSNLDVVEILGQGAQGKVELCQDSEGNLVARKMITSSESIRGKSGKDLPKVLDLMNRNQHENVIGIFSQLFFTGKHPPRPTYIMQYDEDFKDDLDQALKQRPNNITRDNIEKITFQVLSALAHLTELGITHRDVKPANLLVNEACDNVKLMDLDMAAYSDNANTQDEHTFKCGTLFYMAPEVLEGTGYGPKVDIWALDIIILKICKEACAGNHMRNVYDRYVSTSVTLTDIAENKVNLIKEIARMVKKENFLSNQKLGLGPAARTTLARGLQREDERPTANQLLQELEAQPQQSRHQTAHSSGK